MSMSMREQTIVSPDPAFQFEKCLVYETVTVPVVDSVSGESSTVEVVQPITKVFEDGSCVPITGADLEAVQDDIVFAATLGVGCSGCGQQYILKPATSLAGYVAVDLDVNLNFEPFSGVQRFACLECGNIITLVPPLQEVL